MRSREVAVQATQLIVAINNDKNAPIIASADTAIDVGAPRLLPAVRPHLARGCRSIRAAGSRARGDFVTQETSNRKVTPSKRSKMWLLWAAESKSSWEARIMVWVREYSQLIVGAQYES